MSPLCLDAAVKLHGYLLAKHWCNQTLRGPDPGVRLNYRVGRFVKSYIRAIQWRDDYCYIQGQAYWILSNWALYQQLGDTGYRDIALACSRSVLSWQRDDGSWLYPNREWQGRIATAEGTWWSLALLKSYQSSERSEFLSGALRWHGYLKNAIGFQRNGESWAINYFANRGSLRVTNNSVFVLRFLAELARATNNKTYAEDCPKLLNFIAEVQRPTGELPYAVASGADDRDRSHFQCYQYNAFQILDLLEFHQVVGDSVSLRIASRALEFLRDGVQNDGHARYDCRNYRRRVMYHTAVVAAAFAKATQLGLAHCRSIAALTCTYMLGAQLQNGSFWYSRGDYGILRDSRSYPRYLAMILFHLLMVADQAHGTVSRSSRSQSKTA
jgi:hypothetical protein